MPTPVRCALWPILLLVVSGCATRAPAPGTADEAVWLKHRAQVAQLDRWQVQGRIALRVRDEGWTAGFDWHQTAGDWRIRLSGPFGQGVVELSGNADGVQLQQAGRAPVHARDPDALLERETGWRLPIAGLAYWLRGIPAPGKVDALQWDEQGRLQQLRQQGWQIEYRRYQQVGALALPDRLRVQRASMHVRLVLDDWKVR